MPVLAANGVRAYDRLAATTDGKISTSTTEPSYVWVDIDLSKFSAGQHTLALQIIDTKTQKQLTSIPITIDVVHDDATPAPLDVITWSYLNGSPIWHDQAAAFAELLSGGTNVFVIHPANIPGLSLAGDWDKTQEQEFDRQVNLFKSHGQILLVLSWYLGHNPFEAAGDDPDKLAKINKAYYAWLAKLTQHLDSLGVSRQQWGLFITDEPHDKSLELLERIAAYTRRYDPAIRVYANPIPPDNPVSQMLTLSKMTETISIWQPQLLVVESASGYFFRQMKQPWWLYTGPTSPAKAASPMIHYRALPWQAWRFGAVGVGFWAFSDTGRNSGALNDFDGEGPDFAVVYETSSGQGIESSRRWEAFKQGMQDYRLLASAQLNRLEIQSSANYDSAKMDATRAAALAVLRQRNTAKP